MKKQSGKSNRHVGIVLFVNVKFETHATTQRENTPIFEFGKRFISKILLLKTRQSMLRCFVNLVFIFFLFACDVAQKSSHEKSFTWETIPLEKPLSGKKYVIEELKMPGRLLYKENKLVIQDDALSDTFLHILDGTTLDYLFPSGAIGFGPGEMPSAWSIESGLDPETFWVHSLEGKLYSEYSLNTGTDPRALRQIKQQDDFFLAMGLTWSTDSTLMTFLLDGAEKFVEFKTDGTRLKGYGSWKGMVPGDYEDHAIADLHQGKLMGDPEKGIFIKASVFRDRMEILDKHKVILIGVNGPENAIPDFRPSDTGVVTSSDHPLAYMDAFLGREHIFGLYSGKTDRDIMELGRGETDLLVFNLSGEIKELLRLDLPISAFTVDESRNIIFGITADRDPGVAVFEFSLK